MSTRHANTLISIIVLLAMLIQPLATGVTAAPPAEPAAPPHPVDPQRPGYLFRATVTLTGSRNLARLEELGVVVLSGGAEEQGSTGAEVSSSAPLPLRPSAQIVVLADADQLADLARLGFRPQAADELGLLVASQGPERAWLAASLAPLLAQADAVAAQQATAGIAGAAAEPDAAAIQALRAALHALTPEQLAAVAGSISVDDDADGLTNTEEAWWCTDPLNPDTKGNGVRDGQAVANLLSWMNNEISGPPSSGTPFSGWPMVPDDGQFDPNCIDQDQDSVPDHAERWVLGLNPNWESTSGDKFDDGQKLFGLTKYPGYGALPRAEDTFITANMPGWVTAPGTHPLVAAYPQIEIKIVPNSTLVTLVSEITVGETHGEGYTVAYATTHTEGTSMGVGKSESHTYSQWQEIGNSVADSVERSTYQSTMESHSQQYTREHSVGSSSETEFGLHGELTVGVNASIGAEVSANLDALDVIVGAVSGATAGGPPGAIVGALLSGVSVGGSVQLGASVEGTLGASWAQRNGTSSQTTVGAVSGYEVSRESGESYTVGQVQERSQAHGQGYESTQETTITREDYDEFSVTNENQLATTQEWSTATAINTRHVADLQFGYYINNNGTDNARQIERILFNIYIAGERNPISTYATVSVGDSCTPTVINSLYPHSKFPDVGYATQCSVPLNLDQLSRVDQGASIRIVVADYSYGDSDIYENAWGRGVIVEVDDGVWDKQEETYSYLIPTWGAETYQDVIGRYFPTTETANGDIASVYTPEYNANWQIVNWHERSISGRSWWNIYLSEYGNKGVVPFRESMSAPATRLLMRFNQDTDGDYYSDRVEWRRDTDDHDRHDHPLADLVAGFVETRQGNTVQVQMAMANFGTYDAMGTQATLHPVDDSITVGNSLIGLAGLIQPGEIVRLTSRITSPEPLQWSGTAQPDFTGHYTATVDNVYTFTVGVKGDIGIAPNLRVNWLDTAGNSGSFDFGQGYTPPTRQSLAAGIEMGMGSGSVEAGDQFSVLALAPRDVFSYTINSEPYTQPIIVVSYNDPQGNKRFVTPVQLEDIRDDLSQYSDDMLPAPELQIISQTEFDETGANELAFSFFNPTDSPILDGHLVIAYATSVTGTVVAARHVDMTFAPGPNLYTDIFYTSEFSPTYQSEAYYKVKAYATDADGRPLDMAFAQFYDFGKSKPAQVSLASLEWDFGSAQQGTLMKQQFALANVGHTDLLTRLGSAISVTVEGPASRLLPPGDTGVYAVTVNTQDLPVGPFEETILLRTNDPEQPIITLRIHGTVLAAVASAAAFNQDLDTADIMATPDSYEAICDSQQNCFTRSGSGWGVVTSGNPYTGHAYWTYGVNGKAIDWGRFTPYLEHSGRYHFQRWNPSYGGVPTTQSAHVLIHSDWAGDQAFIDNQQSNPGTWATIGSPVRCQVGTGCYMHFSDQVNESSYTHRVWFDAVRFYADPANPIIDSGLNIVDSSTVVVGSSVTVQFRVRNTGDLDWSSSDVRARATGPQEVYFPTQSMALQYDQISWYTQSATFSTPGVYSICGGYGAFAGLGGSCATLRVITPSDPRIIAGVDIVGGSIIAPGEPATVRFTVRNNGEQEWSRTDVRAQATGPETLLFPTQSVVLGYDETAVYESSRIFSIPGTYTICGGYRDFVPLGGGACATLQVMQWEEIRYVRLQAQEYQTLTLDFEVGNSDSGNYRADIDVGGDETTDWAYSGSGSLPVRLTTANLANAFNTYLQTLANSVDVPVHFQVTSLPVSLRDFRAAPTYSPDITLSTGDIAFDSSSPTEGQTATISAWVHNSASVGSSAFSVTFLATQQDWGERYIGSAFVPNVAAGGSAQAEILWNTLGFTGAVPVRVVVDPYNRLAETSEANNEATATLTIRTRPDLSIAGASDWQFSDAEPVVGQTVAITLPVRNAGQTAAGAFDVAVYDGNPAAGGTLVETLHATSLPGGTTADLVAHWTPAAPGEHRLFVEVDAGRAVTEYDEGNNAAWRTLYVGLAGPLLLDSGGGDAYDPAYTAAVGFGYLDGEANTFCGAEPDKTQRSDFDGTVRYRFDHLLPGHYYHLDVTLAECDGTGRQQQIAVDDNVIEPAVDLADGAVHRLSYLLDPAFYADRSIVVNIAEIYGNDVVVSEVNLHDVDYRYSDAGGGSDPAYSAALGYGWLDGVAQTTWGTLPYQSRRTDISDSDPSDNPDNELRYRYDRLDPAKRYQLHVTVYQGAGTATVAQSIAVDEVDTGTTITVVGIQRKDVTLEVPAGTYAADGSILVRIIRTNAQATAFVNLIALEELTLGQGGLLTQNLLLHTTSPNWVSTNIKPPVRPALYCAGVTATSSFTTLAGDALLAGSPASVNSIVEAYTPAGVKVGCFKITTAGKYGYLRVYGAEGATPGMTAGAPIQLKLNGIAAVPTPYPVLWQNDKLIRDVDLAAPDVIPVEAFLDALGGQVVKLQSETGTYLPPPADPRFNTLTTVAPGQGYLLYTNAAAALPVVGARVPADTPLALRTGWNWLGYLPTCELPVATALAGIAGQYDLLHSEAGTYQPPPANPAFNNFNTLAPGRGYMIHLTQAATLVYPANACGAAAHTETVEPPQRSCPAIATGIFTHYYGTVTGDAGPAPAGAPLLAYSPRGEIVGCGQVGADGLLPYLRVYGADGDLPGLRPDEPVAFRLNGRALLAAPAWAGDYDVHRLDLAPGPERIYLPVITR